MSLGFQGNAGAEVSIMSRVKSAKFTIQRPQLPVGFDSTDKFLWAELVDQAVTLMSNVRLTFNTIAELTDFETQALKTQIIKIPNATGGQLITLAGGRWTGESEQARENAEPGEIELTAKFNNITTAVI